MSSSSLDPKPIFVDVDIARVRRILDDVRAVLTPEDYDCLVGVVDALIEVTKAVRERGSTITRLRRLFGLSNSEKKDRQRAAPSARRSSE